MRKLSKEVRFVKGFSGIKVGTICRENNLDQANIQKGKSTKEKEKKLFHILLKKLLLLFIDVYLDDEMEVIEDERNSL